MSFKIVLTKEPNQSEIARICGVTPQAVAQWKVSDTVPLRHVRALCATAPSEFTQLARNRDRSVRIGGRNVVLAPAGGPPFVSDLSGGRRSGTLADLQAFTRLVQHFDVIGVTSPVIARATQRCAESRSIMACESSQRPW